MKKDKEIRSNFVKESLDNYTKLAATINENTENAVRQMLDEAVKNAYANIINEEEDDDKDYEVEEVEDTETQDDDVDAGAAEDADNGMTPEDDNVEVETETEVVEDGDDDGEWEDFEDYKVGDNQYDFSNAEDEEIVKVYKLLKNDDDVIVKKDDNKVNIKDNETGSEYLIMLDDEDNADVDVEDDFEEDGDVYDENEDNIDMNESRIFEIVMNEYDSNVGYTDNYQKKDVMTNPGMTEPGKNVNDWDAGVPKGTKKPWSGKKNDKAENQPFTAEKGKQLEEGVVDSVTDAVSDVVTAPQAMSDKVGSKLTGGATDKLKGAATGGLGQFGESVELDELKTRQEHTANITSTSRTDGDNGNRRRKARSFHTAQNGQETGTADNPYGTSANESVMRKVNKIYKENKELEKKLAGFRKTLEEAAVTNMNLGMIVRLITENTTSHDEKQEIIERFANNAKTLQESENLYNTISNELKKREKMTITESNNNIGTPISKVNETKIYQSKEIMDSLELMNKICKR